MISIAGTLAGTGGIYSIAREGQCSQAASLVRLEVRPPANARRDQEFRPWLLGYEVLRDAGADWLNEVEKWGMG